MTIAFTVYSRSGCHLCDVMVAELRAMTAAEDVTVELVDVDDDPALRAAYGIHVPVLVVDDEELCRYRLDRERVTACLHAARRGRQAAERR
jgi:glutaredoxin